MRRDHYAAFPLLFVTFALPGTSTIAAEPDSVSALTGKGLSRAGSVYVIESEKSVLARIKAAWPALAEIADLAERRMTEEQSTARLVEFESQRETLQDDLAEMNQQILEQAASQSSNGPRPGSGGLNSGAMNPGGMNWGAGSLNGFTSPLAARRDEIKTTLAEVTQEQKLLKAQTPPDKDRVALDAETRKKEEAVKKTLAELRSQVNEVNKQYATLGADAAVKKALADLSRAAKANIKLGPSDSFLTAVRSLDQAERRLLGKAATPSATRKKKTKARR